MAGLITHYYLYQWCIIAKPLDILVHRLASPKGVVTQISGVL